MTSQYCKYYVTYTHIHFLNFSLTGKFFYAIYTSRYTNVRIIIIIIIIIIITAFCKRVNYKGDY